MYSSRPTYLCDLLQTHSNLSDRSQSLPKRRQGAEHSKLLSFASVRLACGSIRESGVCASAMAWKECEAIPCVLPPIRCVYPRSKVLFLLTSILAEGTG